MTDEGKTRLTAVLGNYPHTQPLKRGEVTSLRLALDFTEMKPTNTAFKPMVRELRFDVSEMAIVTFLQATFNGTVDLVLAVLLMVGGVIGARLGAVAARRLKAAQLRLLLALVVLAMAFRLAYEIYVEPKPEYQLEEIA